MYSTSMLSLWYFDLLIKNYNKHVEFVLFTIIFKYTMAVFDISGNAISTNNTGKLRGIAHINFYNKQLATKSKWHALSNGCDRAFPFLLNPTYLTNEGSY